MQQESIANFLRREVRTEEAEAARKAAMHHRQEQVLASSAMVHLKSQIALHQAKGMEIAVRLPGVMKHIELCRLEQTHRSAKQAHEETHQKVFGAKLGQQQHLRVAQHEVKRHNLDVEKLTAEVESVSAQVCAFRHAPFCSRNVYKRGS
jgi:hypothetical protein